MGPFNKYACTRTCHAHARIHARTHTRTHAPAHTRTHHVHARARARTCVDLWPLRPRPSDRAPPTAPLRPRPSLPRFDVIDGGCCAADVLLWLLLQVWAYFYYRRVREHLGHRIEDIAHGKVLAAAKHAALDREEKAAAAAAAAPSASVLAASGVAGALNGVLPSKPSTPGGASNARRDTRRKSMPAPLHRSATRTLERQGLSRSRTQALALPAAPGSNPHSVLKNFAHLSHGAGARGAVDLHDEIDDDLEAEGTAVGGSPPSHASAPLPEPRAAPARAAHSCDPLPAPPPARAPPTAPAPVPVPPIAAAPSVAAPPVRGARTSALLPKMPSSPARTAPAGYVKSDSG